MGPLTFGKNEEQIFLAREISRAKDYSEKTAIKIDEELKRIISVSNQQCREILEGNRKALVRLAEALLEYETLDLTEIEAVMKGEPIRQDEDEAEPPTPSRDSDPQEVKEKGRPVQTLVKPNERPGTA